MGRIMATTNDGSKTRKNRGVQEQRTRKKRVTNNSKGVKRRRKA